MTDQQDKDIKSEDTFGSEEEQLLKSEEEAEVEYSDEFDFSEKQKKLTLKPSKAQKKANNLSKPNATPINENSNDTENDDDGIAIQSNVLSDYLKPTNILSKYQNSQQDPQLQNEDSVEEEEKEWPTSRIEMINLDSMNDDCNDNDNDNSEEEFEEEEEKSDEFELISFNILYPSLIQEADCVVSDSSIITEDFRDIGWIIFFKLYFLGGCSISLSSTELNNERNSIFKIAKLKLDDSNNIHNRMLQTLWIKLTNNDRHCNKIGSHWEEIGFQGINPSTDIRGSGLFGILQLIYIIENYYEIISKIYKLSTDSHQNFPLVIVSFSISGIILELLRSCIIYNEINRHESVIDVINEIYVSLFYDFYLNWKNETRTIKDFDYAKKELHKKAFNEWNNLIKQLEKGLNEIKNNNNNKNLVIAETNNNNNDDDDTKNINEIEFGIQINKQISSSSNKNKQKIYKI